MANNIDYNTNLVYGTNTFNKAYTHLGFYTRNRFDIYLLFNDIKQNTSYAPYSIGLSSIVINRMFNTDYIDNEDVFDYRTNEEIRREHRFSAISKLGAYKREVARRELNWRIKKEKQFPRLNLNFKTKEDEPPRTGPPPPRVAPPPPPDIKWKIKEN
jgi:hypothetical protein